MFYSELKKFWKIFKIVLLFLSVFLIFLIIAETKGVYVKLKDLHPYLAYAFVASLIIIAGLLVLNILSIFRRRPVTTLSDVKREQQYIKSLIKFAKHLSKNSNIDEGDKATLARGIKKINELKRADQNLQEIAKNFKSHDIDLILEKLDEKVRKIISNSVVKMAVLTLIPNRISDLFFSIYINVSMISKISKTYDSRPKLKEGLLVLEDVIAVMGTSAIMNLISRTLGNFLSGIPIIGGFGKTINEGSQAIVVGFKTSIAGHSAQMRFRPLQQEDSEQIRNSLIKKAKEYSDDVKDRVLRLFGGKKGIDRRLSQIDSFMLGSNGSVFLNRIIFYTLYQEVQDEVDKKLQKKQKRFLKIYLDRIRRKLPDIGVEYSYESDEYSINREKIIEELKKMSERKKSILFIETCFLRESGLFSNKKFKDCEFSEENIKERINDIAIASGKSKDFIGRVWETKKEAGKVYKGWVEKFLPFAVGGIVAGLIPLTGLPAIIGGMIGSSMGLSGAAAISAGLAWLGGGSLAAGGFGMAGGATLLSGFGAGLGGVSSRIIFSKLFSKKMQVGKLIEQCYLKLVLLDEENNKDEAKQLIERQQDEIYKLEEEIEDLESLEEDNKNIKKRINGAKSLISIMEKAIEWENKQIERFNKSYNKSSKL